MTIAVSSSLQALAEKVEAGAPWEREDALQLLASFDVIDIGRMAEAARTRILGTVTSVVEAASLRLEETETLVERGVEAAGANGLLLLREPKGWTEPYSAVLAAVSALAARLPVATTLALHSTDLVKALAKLGDRDLIAVLTDLWTAGIRLIAGGADLAVHGAAHQVGIKSIVDLSEGDLRGLSDFSPARGDPPKAAPQSPEAFVDSLLAIRTLQEQTGGFVAARVALQARLSGVPDAKQIACARLVLQNIPHLSLGWNALMLKAAQVLFHFGIDDLGPIQPAKADLKEMAYQIRQTGRQPLLRNGLFDSIRPL